VLQQLNISNYALIEEISVDFRSGLSIITGETGAGKSIIIGAVGLLLGGRSSSNLLLDKNKKSVIEGIFRTNQMINNHLLEMELDCNNELILRKEIKPNGNSRSFINDTPVKVEQLKIISENLIELNGQNLVSNIGKSKFKYEFINDFIENKQLLNQYDESFKNYLIYSKSYSKLLKEATLLNEKKDFLSFQLDELSTFPIDQWDEIHINNEYNLISNQKDVQKYLEEINSLFSQESGVLNKLLNIDNQLIKLNSHLKDLNPIIERLESVRIELEDIHFEIKNKYSIENSSPQRLVELEELTKQINFLLKKFNVVNLESLIEKRDSIQLSLSQIESLDKEIELFDKKKAFWKQKCETLGNKLMHIRKSKCHLIESKVNEVLNTISMEHASFKLHISKSDQITNNGIDKIELLISVNNKLEYYPITKFSSGGELSRIALAMKSVAVNSNSTPILIFDEIDSGISGKVATEVGALLKRISKNIQVINITHLPQVAAFGNSHYHVSKNQTSNITTTKLTILEKEERIQVLANMLGGEKTGNAARKNALELLN
jgi:DNA repair protein RecN (Recombination protein N)